MREEGPRSQQCGMVQSGEGMPSPTHNVAVAVAVAVAGGGGFRTACPLPAPFEVIIADKTEYQPLFFH